MPISVKYNSLFIHIPKTGGTTIEKCLDIYNENGFKPKLNLLHGHVPIKYSDNNIVNPLDLGGRKGYNLQHLTILEIKAILEYSVYSNLFKFTFVRNPWDRIVSEYIWAYAPYMEFNVFIEKVHFVVINKIRLNTENAHFRPQTEYINEDIDFIGRFEDFKHHLRVLFKKINHNINAKEIPHEKKSIRKHYSSYYTTKKEIDLVFEAYENDINSFNYRFEENN